MMLRAIVIGIALTLPTSALAATDYVLKIDGIPGESKLTSHINEIDVLSFDWEVAPTESKRPVVCPKDLSITKFIDAASPALALAALSRQPLGEVRLVGRLAGNRPIDYLTITLKNVAVKSYHTGGKGSDERIVESVSFTFSEITATYIPLDEQFAPKPARSFSYQTTKACLPK